LLPASRWFLAWRTLQSWRWRTYSSEASVDFQQATRRYIPEDRTFHNHRCENFKSNNLN
jgi:hypothetical protein